METIDIMFNCIHLFFKSKIDFPYYYKKVLSRNKKQL